MHLIKKLTLVGGFAALSALPILLGACGHKGPLYIPAPTTPAPSTSPTATTPATTDDSSRAGSGTEDRKP